MGDVHFILFGNDRITFTGEAGALVWEEDSPVVPGVPGIVIPFAGTVSPEGYLLCDGSAVSRSTYALLYAVIGDTYGAGDGSTTFNLPDLRGMVVLGVSNSHSLGSTGGSETVTLTDGNLPAHSHEVPQHGHGDDIAATTPELSHEITQPAFNYNNPKGSTTLSGSDFTAYTSVNTPSASRTTNVAVADHDEEDCTMSGSVSNKVAFSSDSTGGGTAHNNMQPYMAINYLISTGE